MVVSNAAGFVPGDITDVSRADWERMRQTNIDGFFYLAQKTLPLLARSGGNLVATSSVSGLRGDWSQSAYNATKAPYPCSFSRSPSTGADVVCGSTQSLPPSRTPNRFPE